jgi:iron(III) transport system permease protein
VSRAAALVPGRPGRRLPILVAAPAVVTVAAVLLPLAYLVVRASSASREAWQVLDVDVTGRLVLDTAVLTGAVVVCAAAVALPLAWLVVRTDVPGRAVWAVAAAVPLVIPSYVAALALLSALGPRGLVQSILEEPFGVERLPEIYGLPGAVLALTLATYPYVFILAAAALRGLDPSLEEAARSLGRSPVGVFLRVTLPALRPALAAGCLLVALYVLSDFGVVSLMQYPALTRAVYLQYDALFDREPAAVLSLVLVALALLVLVVESHYGRRARFYRASPGAARRPRPVRLGRWRWLALTYCAAVVGVMLVLPVTVLVYWAAQAAPRAAAPRVPWEEAANSLLAAAIAAAVAVAAALPVALLAHRHRSAWTLALKRAAFTANALPGIVVALSLVFFAARYGTPVYGTLALLVFAYVVRFLPQALASADSALQMVDPHLEEAARGLGRRPAAVLVMIVGPLVRPGVLAGAALVFLSAMKELPATLLLRPIGFDTLATEVWTATSAAAYAEAAPPALLLIAASAPLVYLLGLRRGLDIGPGG